MTFMYKQYLCDYIHNFFLLVVIFTQPFFIYAPYFNYKKGFQYLFIFTFDVLDFFHIILLFLTFN